jgi:small subunit ribosomal protein S9
MPTTPKKTITTKKPAAPRKPRAVKETTAPVAAATAVAEIQPEKVEKEKVPQIAELNLADGRYAWAVGRRKTSVANVRLFQGKGKNTVNNKDIMVYFGNKSLVERAFKPLQLTGLESRVYVYVNINGGGLHSQSEAISQGIATALAKNQPEFRKVLKKNGTLTRDSRKKERKKPGLKRARRGSQWAKR